jgi:MHS family proline/betaine transporter-like MFS transporter
MSEPLAPSDGPQASLTRTVVAGAVGNMLEWYDFGLFGYFTPVIGRLFLPAEDRLASLMGTFAIFASGFLMRPLGGLLFGYVGDRMGRKRALELSVVLMAISTTLLGLLPPHAAIGLAAPVLLTLIRLLQGLSVGGEYIGSMSFLVEHAPPGRRAFTGSWSSFSVVLGSLLGSGTAALCTGLLTPQQLADWGWRVPFLAGLLIGAAGFWLRMGVEESPGFLRARMRGRLAANPLAEAFRNDRGAIATTLGLTALMSIGYYVPFVWLPTWASQINQPPLSEDLSLTANTIALLALLLLTPVSGLVADRVGRRPMFLASALAFVLFSYPVFRYMSAGTFGGAVLGGLAFAVASALFAGCMAATLVELFPTRTRYTGVAIGYNLGQAVLGGTAPLVATALSHVDVLAPAFYLIAAGLVAAVACLFITWSHGRPPSILSWPDVAPAHAADVKEPPAGLSAGTGS